MDTPQWIPFCCAWKEFDPFEYSYVLDALGINWFWDGKVFWIKSKDFSRAQTELFEYQREKTKTGAEANFDLKHFSSANKRKALILNTLALTTLLISFIAQQYFPWLSEKWILDGEKIIVHGQYYRLFTALLLHKDPAHVLGNVVFSFYFLFRLSLHLGFGLTWLLVLSLATLANGVNLCFLGLAHKSLGFSTASFVAVGLFVTTEKSKNLFLAGAAGLIFLAMFSGGKYTDVGSHFWGFVLGFLAGIILNKRGQIED